MGCPCRLPVWWRACGSGGGLIGRALPEFLQHLVGRDVERVLLQDAADNDHRMSAHYVDYNSPAKLGEIVCSYDGVFIARKKIVQPRLVFYQIIHARPVFERPFHVRDQTCEREPEPPAFLKHLLY